MNKIMFLTYTMMFGGVEKVVATLANSFSDKGIQCTIMTVVNEQCEFVLNDEVKLFSLYENTGKPGQKDYVKCFKKLRAAIKEEKPDVVLAMPEEISCKAIPFMLGLGVPIVVSERNNPWIMPSNKLNRILRRIFYPMVDGIVFQTEQAASFFPKHVKKKSKVIMNPLDTSRLPKKFAIQKRKEIVSVGRHDKQKNHKMLLEAYADFYKKHSDYKLILYGNGILKRELEEYASNIMPKEAYEFIGATNDVLDRINGAEIFVLSSDYEGLPNALIEAMALGITCISTDCPSGGPQALIDNYQNGVLVPVGDINALEKEMSYMADNKDVAEMLGENAKKIADLLKPEIIVAKWKNYLEEVAALR